MKEFSTDNKKIARNTMILYIRMLLLMVVSLYTSRIVLDALGIIDYGLYNVVGGIVIALGFLSGTLNTASSRFITVALSTRKLEVMQKTFSNILFVNVLLSFVILIGGETIGLWFLCNKIQIPLDRFNAAFWVYQMSILTVMVNIISSAYNACIIAHEKMEAFAYISLIDALGKLMIAYSLIHVMNSDRLVMYGGLILFMQLVNRFVYSIYCSRNFPETKVGFLWDKAYLTKMFKFITWASYGSFVSIGFTQGLNILLNIFFGPAVNTARAISVQVQNAIVLFTTNFQAAINPQLIKNVAIGDNLSAQKLLASSKFSFFLLCLLGIPLIIIAPTVLNLWLKEVPEYTVVFVRLMLVISIWSSIANPLRIVNQAEGNIKKFQIYEGTVLLFIVPVSFCVLKLEKLPELVFVVHLFVELLASYIRIKIVLPKIGMRVCDYCKCVYLPLTSLNIFCPFTYPNSKFFTSNNASFLSLFLGDSFFSIVLLISLLSLFLIFLVYEIGLNQNERKKIVEFIKTKIDR